MPSCYEKDELASLVFLEMLPRNVLQFWQILNFATGQQKHLRNSKSNYSTFVAKVTTKFLGGTKEILECCLELLQSVVTINTVRLVTIEAACQKKKPRI
jgi:hypothetical protein